MKDSNLQEEVLSFYKNLFSSNVANMHSDLILNNIIVLSSEGVTALTKEVTNKEVHKTLMSMDSYKSPGMDGFQTLFLRPVREFLEMISRIWLKTFSKLAVSILN